MRVKYIVLLLLAGLLTAGGFAGIARATSRATPAFATTSDKVRFSPSAAYLSTAGMTNVTIVYMPLPAGSWVLTAKGNFVNFGPSDYARCQLFADTTAIPGGGITTMVGDSTLPGAQGPGTFVQAFADMGAITSATNFTASLQCSHDQDTPSGFGPPYIDPGVTIWAHRSS